MGNICNHGSHEKQQTTETVDTLNKNFPICEFIIKNTCKVSLIMGTYRYHRAETLLLITQTDFLEYCPQLREYSQNFNSTVEQASSQRKRLLYVSPNKTCPYKKIQLCILPPYNSNQSQSFIQQFQNSVQQILSANSDITLQLAFTSDNSNGLPNQTLLSVFLKFISTNVSKSLKISILSSQMKLLNMVRYEIIKLENYTINMLNNEIHF